MRWDWLPWKQRKAAREAEAVSYGVVIAGHLVQTPANRMTLCQALALEEQIFAGLWQKYEDAAEADRQATPGEEHTP